MKKVFTILLLAFSVYSFAQTNFYWRDPGAANAQFDGGSGTVNWWNGSSGVQACGFGNLRFGNNHYSGTMNNNIPAYGTHQIIFESTATTSRTITNNGIRFYDFSTDDPKIENYSTATHSFTCLIEGDGDASDPLEINPVNGNINIVNLDNKGSNIKVYGINSKVLSITGVVSGGGGIELMQTSKVVLSGANTYSGITDINAGSLEVAAGGTLGNGSSNVRVASGATLDVQDDIAVNNLTVDGTLTIASGKILTVNGTLTLNTTIDLAGGNILLNSGTPVSGSFDTSNMIITSGSGELRRMISASGSHLYPIGTSGEYTPVTLNFTSVSGSAYAGVRSIASEHPSLLGLYSDYLERNWDLTESGLTSFSCDITCVYADGDIVGNESNIYCGKYSGGSWTFASAASIATNTLSFAGATSFSQIAGAQLSAVPVELIDFSAFLNHNNEVELQWSTASEYNASHFNVVKMINGTQQVLGEVQASGNSTEVIEYNYTDIEPIANSSALYFLEQVDFNEASEWYGPVSISTEPSNEIITGYDPSANKLILNNSNTLEYTHCLVRIVSLKGELLFEQQLDADNNRNTVTLPILSSGMYLVQIITDSDITTQKIIL